MNLFKSEKGIENVQALVVVTIVILIIAASGFYDKKLREREEQEKAKIAAIEAEKNKEKENFIASIEDHYRKAVELYKAKNYEELAKALEAFSNYGQSGYKDIESLSKKMKIDQLEQKAKQTPASDAYINFLVYRDLLELDPANSKYKQKFAYYQAAYKKKKEKEEQETRKALQKSLAELQILSWQWSEDYGYVTAEGQVKNIAGRRLEHVEALVTWYDKNENMITSDSALIEYDPLLPGQNSPFKVIARYNPAMKSAYLEFKTIRGEAIPAYREK